jgi:hypothetical protein
MELDPILDKKYKLLSCCKEHARPFYILNLLHLSIQ